MSDFNPYHIWLGIPETERPISKYRLLALTDFEDNREVIGAAAEQRTIYLRTMQAGEHAVLVADLLNEVSQARVTLLNANQKAEYDEQLRKQQTPEPVPEPTPPPIPVVQTPAPNPVMRPDPQSTPGPISVVQPPTPLQNIPLPTSQNSTPFPTPQISITTPRRSKRRVRGKVFKVAVASVMGTVIVITLILALSDYTRTPAKPTPEQLMILEEERLLVEKQKEIDQLVDNAVRASDEDDYEEADNLFNQALTLGASGDANMWRAYQEFGESYEDRGDHQKALDNFQVAVSLARSSDERGKSTVNEGVLLIRLGEDTAGLRKIQEAQEIIPDDAWLTYYRGRELRKLQRYEEAIPFLEQSIKLGSTSGWAQNDLADLKLYHIPDFKKAYELLEQVANFDLSCNTAYWKRRAYASSKLGNWQDVLTETQRGLAIESDDKYDKDLLEMQSLAREALRPEPESESEPTVRTLTGHTDDVLSVAFSPDGRWIVSGSNDRTIKLWDAQTYAERKTLVGHDDDIYSIAFSPNGKTISSGSEDDTIKLWDAETGVELRTLKEGDAGNVTSVVYSPDGKIIVSGNEDTTIKLWNPQTGAVIKTLKGHSKAVTSVAFSPDGKRLASASYDDTIKLWNIETGLEKTLDGHSNDVNSVAYCSDGKTIASGSDDRTIKIWDSQTGVVIKTLEGHARSVESVTFSPDGKTVASGSDDETIKIWDIETGAELKTLTGHTSIVKSVAFSPSGKTLVSSSFDKTIKLWDVEPAPANTLPASLQQGLIAYYPLNGNAYDESGNNGLVEGAIQSSDRFGHEVACYKFDGKDDRIVAQGTNWPGGNTDRTVSLWFFATGNEFFGGNLFTFGDGSESNMRFSMRLSGKGSELQFIAQNNDESASVKNLLHDWHHLVISLKSGTGTICVDGSIAFEFRKELNTKGSMPLVLGSDSLNKGGQFFTGSIDDVRIYNRALSAAEVKILYDFESKPPNQPIPTAPATEPITNTIGMTLNKIPAGTFIMGSPEDEAERSDIEHQHRVTITKAFYIQTTEVTQGQWKEVMGTEPWKGQGSVKEGPNYAASYVNWDDAVAYCKKLSEQEGKTYRLPTEAEWEYACRAGTQTAWYFGDDEKNLGDYAWYGENAGDFEKYAHHVVLKKPNAFGLYDMHGNVLEWCDDYYAEDYYQQSPTNDPRGPARGSSRVLRGGSWYFDTRRTRSAYRYRYDAGLRNRNYGFRVVRELD